jgi:hypothetical protein
MTISKHFIQSEKDVLGCADHSAARFIPYQNNQKQNPISATGNRAF